MLYERYLDLVYTTQRSQWRERLWARTELNWASASGFLTGQGRIDKQDGKVMTTTESKAKKRKQEPKQGEQQVQVRRWRRQCRDRSRGMTQKEGGKWGGRRSYLSRLFLVGRDGRTPSSSSGSGSGSSLSSGSGRDLFRPLPLPRHVISGYSHSLHRFAHCLHRTDDGSAPAR